MVVPVYNSAEVLPELVARLEPVLHAAQLVTLDIIGEYLARVHLRLDRPAYTVKIGEDVAAPDEARITRT